MKKYKLIARVRPKGKRWINRETLVDTDRDLTDLDHQQRVQFFMHNHLIAGGEVVGSMQILDA